jgi:hypothetical protein
VNEAAGFDPATSAVAPCGVRARHDVTAGAPSSGSRVILCSLHHVTPADGAPRCCMYCVSFPDHRLSNSGSKKAWHLESSRAERAARRRGIGASHSPVDEKDDAPPGAWRRRGVSNRSDPMIEGDALRRVPPEPGPCSTVFRVERAVHEPARSPARYYGRLLLPITRLPHSHAALGLGEFHRPLRTRSHRADVRAPARGEPVLAGVPSACDREMGERGHGIRQYERLVMKLRTEYPETRNRAADDRLTSGACQGWANAHAVAWCIDS